MPTVTRSQAIARIAERTVSQHLWGSRDVIDHVTIWYPIVYVISKIYGPLFFCRLITVLLPIFGLNFLKILCDFAVWGVERT